MGDVNIQEILNVACEAAYGAGRRTLAWFNTGVEVETKKDGSPVTCADRAAEEFIRDSIQRRYPGHCIVGEEFGQTDGDPDFKWFVDPIDGTKSFIHGAPLYGVLIGVEVKGEAAVGVIYLPATDELIAAANGLGCTCNGRRARVSNVRQLSEATMLVTDTASLLQQGNALEQLAKKVKLARGWGDCFGYAMVATGRAEIMIDAKMNAWDAAPMLPILREAGGQFTNWAGKTSIYGPDGVGSNGALHDEVMAILQSGSSKRQ